MADFNNQYLLTSKEPHCIPSESFVHHGVMAQYAIYASENISVEAVRDGDKTIVVIGDIFDPQHPNMTNEEIAHQIATRSAKDSIFETLQLYSGRYVVVVVHPNHTLVVPDPACLQRVLFTDDGDAITSSPKLFLNAFGLERDTAPDVESFATADTFMENDAVWAGTKTLDRRLTRLLPNHYLDARDATIQRRPLYQPPISTREDVIDSVAGTLRGTLKAISERYENVQFPLTAGWDSRLLLAAAEPIEDDVHFITSAAKIEPTHPDIRIPLAFADSLDLDYHIFRPREFTDEFVAAMEENYLNPRLTPKIRNIQHHYYHADRGQSAALTGNVAEIARTYYGPPESPATPEVLADLFHYSDSAFVREAFAEWLPSAERYAERTGIDIYDLFYWEQRMGNWGSRHPYENDIATHELAPFNNYNLLLSALSIPASERTTPEYSFFREFIERTRPELLSHPINPLTPQKRVKQGLVDAADQHRTVNAAKEAYIWVRDRRQ